MANKDHSFVDYFLKSQNVVIKIAKNNQKSKEFREQGNEHFSKKVKSEYINALRLYNKSICYAKNGSKELALGYSNRSAVYFELKMFKECLASIELAKSVAGYPSDLNEKLKVRVLQCRKSLTTGRTNIGTTVPKLSYPAHKRIPFVANCVELRRGAEYGRHLVANRDLRVGDIIAIETPYCTIVPVSHRYERCEYCAREHAYNLIPCEACTAVMFCSYECRTNAMNSFHKYECAAIDYIHTHMLTPELMIPVRIALAALASLNGDAKTLFECAEDEDNDPDGTTIFQIDYTRRLSPVGKFAPVYGMIDAKDATNTMVWEWGEQIAAMILYEAQVAPPFLDHPTIRYLMKIIKHFSSIHAPLIRLYTVRSLVMSDIANKAGEIYMDESRGVYPLRFLFNHSCVPNVVTTTYGNKLVMSVSRPVRAGQQLFVEYWYAE